MSKEHQHMRRRLIAHLSKFVTAARLSKMKSALEARTRYLTVVLEDIYQPHNASAVLRSCDGFGVQDVHIIENRNAYEVNPKVELGTSNWLSLYTYKQEEHNTREAVSALREGGYRIVATTPDPNSEREVALEEFDLQKGKTALLFGNELDGLTPVAHEEADEFMYIPMYGFVESFNISVSCALSLHYLTHFLRSSSIDWKLEEAEKEEILLNWLRSSIKRWETIEEEWKRAQMEEKTE